MLIGHRFWCLSVQGIRLCDGSREDYHPGEDGDGYWGHCVSIHRAGDEGHSTSCRKSGSGFETSGDVAPLRNGDRFDVWNANICTKYQVWLVSNTVVAPPQTFIMQSSNGNFQLTMGYRAILPGGGGMGVTAAYDTVQVDGLVQVTKNSQYSVRIQRNATQDYYRPAMIDDIPTRIDPLTGQETITVRAHGANNTWTVAHIE